MTTMRFEELELAYEGLADAIDRAGAGNEALFLTKLALMLAHRVGQIDVVQACIEDALKDLPPAATPAL
jgi:hypothetical protein